MAIMCFDGSVASVIREKENLEKQILALLSEFESVTSLNVEGIHLRTMVGFANGGTVEVEVKVILPPTAGEGRWTT